jgi:4-amino-4-deoxy-L-arabinose transferase-like glycosyltransferase
VQNGPRALVATSAGFIICKSMTSISPPIARAGAASTGRVAFMVCAMLLAAFAGLSWSAVQTKNATIDEPLHALSGWVAVRFDDFRLVPESPSLWQCLAALPNARTDLKIHFGGKVFSDRSFDSQGGIDWTNQTLYRTAGNDGEAFVNRSRVVFLVLGVLLGALIGWWTFRLAGGLAAIVAVGFFSLDPNFLAHAPIVKSDVPLALIMLALACTIWCLGRQARLRRMIAASVLCGLGINTKFSGLLLLPMLAMLLCVRAVLPMPWIVAGKFGSTRRSRLAIAAMICVLAGFICFGITWAAYGFRFRPAPGITTQMDMQAIDQRAILLEAAAASKTHDPTPIEIANWKPSLLMRSINFADHYHLLPQAMLGGLLYQHACLQLWPSYLLGRLYGIGRWYYYPLAMLFKTPLATLLLFAGAALIAFRFVLKSRRDLFRSADVVWATACLLVPFGMLAIAAMQSNLDIGLRSILPLYPFLFVGAGVMTSQAMKHRRRWTLAAISLLSIALAAEALPAWPNYISFFNTAAGGSRGGFALLGDSNLDWGQDLKPLVAWQQQHPDVPIFLHYFGSVDPAFFKLRFHDFELAADGSHLISDIPMQTGVLAISTNYLQGLFDTPHDVMFFRKLAERPPDQVVGGSIYLYRYPL